MRSTRNAPATDELVSISGADPLNLVGILTPGPRIAALSGNRIVLRDGLPIAAREGGHNLALDPGTSEPERVLEATRHPGGVPIALRPHYA